MNLRIYFNKLKLQIKNTSNENNEIKNNLFDTDLLVFGFIFKSFRAR